METSQLAQRRTSFDTEAMQRDDVLVRRMGYPEEMAAAVAFLCSARASYITGISSSSTAASCAPCGEHEDDHLEHGKSEE